jgi:phosphatidylglycerol:prolipoprotein diacylglycerol transferase
MQPYFLQFERFSIAAYPFMFGLALAVAGSVFVLLLRSTGATLRARANLFLLIVLAVVVGGRLMYGIMYWREARTQLRAFLDFTGGGEVLYGSLLAAALVAVTAGRLARIPAKSVLDAAAVSAPLGVAIGRIGCFCYGCCYGTPTQLPIGVRFPKMINTEGNIVGSLPFLAHVCDNLISAAASRSAPIHPVQLYEFVADLLLFVVLALTWKCRRFAGRLAPLFIFGYCAIRFCMEFLRTEERYGPLSVYQCLSIVIGLAAMAWFLVQSRRSSSSPRRLMCAL